MVGADDQAAAARVGELFAGTQAPLLITDAATAETIKYASNAFLATKLSFVNAVASLCEAVGADVRDVILGLGYDKRIGFEFMKPGPGWGGSCLPKDTRALVHIAEQAGYDFSFLKGAIATNDEQFERVVAKVRTPSRLVAAGTPTATSRTVVAVWGLTFKAGTDDLPQLAGRRGGAPPGRRRRRGAGLRPHRRRARRRGSVAVPGSTSPRARAPVAPTPTPTRPARVPRVVVVLTEWDEFRWLDFAKVRDALAAPVFVDARNLLDPAAGPPPRLLLRGDRPPVSGRVVVTGRGRASSAPTCATSCSPGVTRSSASTTSPPGAAANVAHLAGHAGFSLVEADISRASRSTGRSTASATSPAPPRLPTTWRCPLETLAVGSEGTRHGLELAKRHGARFLMASTSEVYGDPDVHPQAESYWGNVNPVGPAQRLRRGQALHRGAHHGPPPHAGDRRGHRPDLQHLRSPPAARRRPGGVQLPPPGDAGRAPDRLRRRQPDPEPLLRGRRGPGPPRPASTRGSPGPVNIGNPDEYTVIELARTVIELLGSSSVIEHRPLPTDDPTRRRPDITVARAELGWEPTQPRGRTAGDGAYLARRGSPGPIRTPSATSRRG